MENNERYSSDIIEIGSGLLPPHCDIRRIKSHGLEGSPQPTKNSRVYNDGLYRDGRSFAVHEWRLDLCLSGEGLPYRGRSKSLPRKFDEIGRNPISGDFSADASLRSDNRERRTSYGSIESYPIPRQVPICMQQMIDSPSWTAKQEIRQDSLISEGTDESEPACRFTNSRITVNSRIRE